MTATIGITGGSGYIGSSISKKLSNSYNIKLIDIKQPKQKLPENVSFEECDLRDYDAVKKAMNSIDLVIHTAIIQIPEILDKKMLAYEVNILGTNNVCRAVEESAKVKGLILSGSWHTIGEKELRGTINEEFGFRPDKVEDRARLYALSKMAQESIVRFYDEMSSKIFGIIRMGTVLGEGMPEKTAANIFIENGLQGKPLTPFSHSMFRPMLYVDINDICETYRKFAEVILEKKINKNGNSISHIFNVYYPETCTILELAKITKDSIVECSKGQIRPEIIVVETKQPCMFSEIDKYLIKVDTTRAAELFDLKTLKSPIQSIETIVRAKLEISKNS